MKCFIMLKIKQIHDWKMKFKQDLWGTKIGF